MNFIKNLLKKVPKKSPKSPSKKESPKKPPDISKSEKCLPTRKEIIKSLKKDEFDVVVIGGGITGAGCALDAVTRGLKTALIEHDDFASGTSSRSTKLIHGGVRYLQEAVTKLDTEQFKILQEALYERGHMLSIAPHLARPLAFLVPVYQWWKVPYVWSGMKLYDTIAGFRSTLRGSSLHTAKTVREMFPNINPKGLCGGVVYYDGQMDDARFNLAVALTAAKHGATILNHATVTALIKEKIGKKDECAPIKITAVCAQDCLTNTTIMVKTKCVINAAGTFVDDIRKMNDRCAPAMCTPSCGVHVVLPGCYASSKYGLINASSDGRVIFLIPWQGHALAGTTDKLCKVTFSPQAHKDEVHFILNELNKHLHPDIKVGMNDILSCWSGIRPLVTDPNKKKDAKDTKSIARNHVISISNHGLITVTGGKYTTYRVMAKETVDKAIKAYSLKPKHTKCQTDKLLLVGAHKWSATMYFKLMKDYDLSCKTAKHLSHAYGDQAFKVAEMAKETRKDCILQKLHPKFNYLEAEIKQGINEYAVTAVDMIARRMRIAFLNRMVTHEILPKVVKLMAKELKWNKEQQKEQMEEATEFLCSQMRVIEECKKKESKGEKTKECKKEKTKDAKEKKECKAGKAKKEEDCRKEKIKKECKKKKAKDKKREKECKGKKSKKEKGKNECKNEKEKTEKRKNECKSVCKSKEKERKTASYKGRVVSECKNKKAKEKAKNECKSEKAKKEKRKNECKSVCKSKEKEKKASYKGRVVSECKNKKANKEKEKNECKNLKAKEETRKNECKNVCKSKEKEKKASYKGRVVSECKDKNTKKEKAKNECKNEKAKEQKRKNECKSVCKSQEKEKKDACFKDRLITECKNKKSKQGKECQNERRKEKDKNDKCK